ncbi:hypothetical protein GCM10009660_37230 [Catellatospora bangladeshensis]
MLPLAPDTLMNTDDSAMHRLPAIANSAGCTRARAGGAVAGRVPVVVTSPPCDARTIKDKRMFVSGSR